MSRCYECTYHVSRRAQTNIIIHHFSFMKHGLLSPSVILVVMSTDEVTSVAVLVESWSSCRPLVGFFTLVHANNCWFSCKNCAHFCSNQGSPWSKLRSSTNRCSWQNCCNYWSLNQLDDHRSMNQLDDGPIDWCHEKELARLASQQRHSQWSITTVRMIGTSHEPCASPLGTLSPGGTPRYRASCRVTLASQWASWTKQRMLAGAPLASDASLNSVQ